MKKLLTIFLSSLMMMSSIPTVAFAEEIPQASIVSTEEDNSLDFYGVEPLDMNYVHEYNGYVRLQLSNSFNLSSKAHLKFTISATAPCTMKVYKGNTLISTIDVPGDTSGHSYVVKKNAAAGTYRYVLTTDDYNCYAVFNFRATQYL